MLYQVANDEVLKECTTLRHIPVDEFYSLKSSFISHIVQTKNYRPFLVCEYFREKDCEELKTYKDPIPRYSHLVSSREVLLGSIEHGSGIQPELGISVIENMEPISSVEIVDYESKIYIKFGIIGENGKKEFILCSFLSEVNIEDYRDFSKEIIIKGAREAFKDNIVFLELPNVCGERTSVVNPNEFLDGDNIFDIYTYGMGISMLDVKNLEMDYKFSPNFNYSYLQDKVSLDLHVRIEFEHRYHHGERFNMNSNIELSVVKNLTPYFLSFMG